MIHQAIEKGLESSRVLLICMSKHFFASEWATFESGTFRFRDPTNKERRFIPLRLDRSEIPLSLRPFAYVPWGRKPPDSDIPAIAQGVPSEHSGDESGRNPRLARSSGFPESSRSAIRTRSRASPSVRTDVVIASASGDKTVRVWDAASGRCEATLQGHTDAVLSVSWSGDGGRLASGSSDNTVRVWDAASGRCEATLPGHTDAVLSVSWSGDGGRLASGSSDNTVRVWDAASGRCEATLPRATPTAV